VSSVDELAGVVSAAIHTAEKSGQDVADVPLASIAAAIGVSRSTLLRRLGGSRRTLDEAVRAAGVDPGGRPVRARAIDAAARLVSERGLATVTLEAVAEAAGCSVHSLYAIFGSRDEFFAAIYEKYSPLSDLEQLFAEAASDLEQTVSDFYQTMAVDLTREPRVAAAMLADLLGNPNGPAAKLFARYFPRALSSVGGWLETQMRAGRIRNLPVGLLMQQLLGPLLAHLLMRPVMGEDLQEACAVFTDTFLRAVKERK
jgi:AcrR family transcriptional regulator